jgi:NADPH:quinone reductase-like Zn-dependent oxidoreductase
MKAMVYHQYGPPGKLQLQEIEKPVVKDDELRVKVHSASVNWLDWHFLMGTPFLARLMAGGLFKPKNGILGVDLAGTVETVGSNITHFQSGEQVFGGSGNGGTFAEYVCVREDEVQLKPANLTFEESAAVGAAASTALHGLRDTGEIKPGQKVVINGASGGVGTFAVQIAKSYGTEVTGVCSTNNLDLVRSIGADHTLDYTQEDFTRNGQRYDLIFDVVAKLSFSDCRHVLNPEGIYVTTEFTPGLAIGGLWTSFVGDKKMAPLPPKAPTITDQVFVKELIEAGKVKPVIDRRYKLSELPEALLYLEKGHARGKVVITVLDE